jgi:hypothetical protein
MWDVSRMLGEYEAGRGASEAANRTRASGSRHFVQHTVRSMPAVDVEPEPVAPGVQAVPVGAEISA